MSVFKCKMCGGALKISDGQSVVTCEYCGTQQTLPHLNSDRKANLFDRANHFRRNNEFDKAAGIYEQLLNEDPADAETYWSLVLCRYGIEYVEDPRTHTRVPTVNRTQYTSVFDDDNYKSALKYADEARRRIYEQEARAVNELQKGILAISQKEEPFDVFICYKETDEAGRRTPDSVLANDLYHQLTQEGFKVFFSRITLEDKLGSAYEPYIFAALNSAKVMVVIGTKPEFFNAVWVKNEWSRYLALIKQGQNKTLIPAFRDMDPYDLPEEFSHLQAQDMSKLGFMQDLIRGIKKLSASASQAVHGAPTAASVSVNAGVEALLKRVNIFLEDDEWDSAEEYCEKVLDIDPENARAYLGKVLAELKMHTSEELFSSEKPIKDNKNFKKALRFADSELKRELEAYYTRNVDANEKKQKLIREACIAKMPERVLSAGNKDIALRNDGTIFSTTYIKPEVMDELNNLIAVCASSYGLRADGRVISIGSEIHMQKWENIVAICSGDGGLAGLKADGTVVTSEQGIVEKKISAWNNIVAISSGCGVIFGVKADGTVVYAGEKEEYIHHVSDWKDIVAVSAGLWHTVGLRSDGTVIAAGSNSYGECDVSDWRDIVAVSAGGRHTVGLKSDGTVVATNYIYDNIHEYKHQCDVCNWGNIVSISAGHDYTLGLKADGTVVGTGYATRNVSNWCDIEVAPEAIEQLKKRAAVIAECKRKKQALLEDERRERIKQEAIHSANMMKKQALLENKRREKKEQEAIYSANMMKLFGEGARKRDAAIAEINRLKAEIAALEEELQE